ncbi:MAG: molybdopterin-dependent oxidoreductase [Chloroflexi bacterium]|nr:molybdopterin-dependent oxidoreductase [Chloroflexota bacterium]
MPPTGIPNPIVDRATPWLVLAGALMGGFASLPLIAISYLGDRVLELPFFPFDLFDWLARVLPGNVITLGIDGIVQIITSLGLGPISEVAKGIEQLLGILLVVAGGVCTGAAIAWIMGRTGQPGLNIGTLAGFSTSLVVLFVELSLSRFTDAIQAPFPWAMGMLWLVLLISGWGGMLGLLLAADSMWDTEMPGNAPDQPVRRSFLVKFAGGSLLLALAAWGGGRILARPEETSGSEQILAWLASPTPEWTATSMASTATATAATATPGNTATARSAPAATLAPSATSMPTATPLAIRDLVPPAPGTRQELTLNEEFYRIDVNLRPPVIKQAAWALQVTGLFDRTRTFTLEELMAFPAVTQPVTLGCISNPIGGDLISTSNWTGLRLRDMVENLGLRPEAQALYLKSIDGFYESVVLKDVMDLRTLLVYGMNGETLPNAHGFPLRI